MPLSLFRKDPDRQTAIAVYGRLVEAARRPEFYRDGAPDTVEGRFEILAVHMFLALRRLKRDQRFGKVSAALVEIFFQNMDDSLRELGVGDLVVGKRIRKMAEAFYGRAEAYAAALDSGDGPALDAAVARNVFGDVPDTRSARLAAYMRLADEDAKPGSNLDVMSAASFPSFEAQEK